MLTSGFIAFLAVVLVMLKLPRRLLLRALKRPIYLDLIVAVLTLFIHFGTFSGVMAATVAGLLTSIATSAARRLVGYIDGDQYFPGRIRLDV